MKTMKKFWKYFINFVVLFLIVSGLMYLGTMNNNNQEKDVINCIAQTEKPVIEVTECTSNNKKGILKGTVTNDAEVLINVIYVKAEFYDENNNILGTKYSEIKYFNVGEKAKFEIEFDYENVSKVNVTATETNV